jgi:hypothetical protein
MFNNLEATIFEAVELGGIQRAFGRTYRDFGSASHVSGYLWADHERSSLSCIANERTTMRDGVPPYTKRT